MRLKKLKNKLEELSTIDPLTDIHNRRYFMESVTKQMIYVCRQQGESFIIMLDLDHFKDINDKYGHPAGDKVLIETAACIGAILRPYDIFARYGGEEFILFVSGITKESVIQLAERIRVCISKNQINIKSGAITITASFGIAPAAPENDLSDAIALADKALYQAKQEGRNRVVFN